VQLRQPKNGQRKFIGKIKAVSDNNIELEVDNEIVTFELANINKAKLSF
jgi:ribosome maturation factor RimP